MKISLFCEFFVITVYQQDWMENFTQQRLYQLMTYGEKCWPINKQQVHKMRVVEIRTLTWKCGKTRKDGIKNEHFQEHLGAVSINDKIRETHLRGFGHAQCRPTKAPMSKKISMQANGPPRGGGRPKRTWMEVVKIDLKNCNISKDLAQDRSE